MKLHFSPESLEQLTNLQKIIQKKANKQFQFLVENYRHPSLRARKMSGLDRFEARVDRHYRFTFRIKQDEIQIITIGQHDEGLGKK